MAIFSEKLQYRIDGGSVGIFGDTHLSAIFKGSHINYQEENLDMMARMIEIVKEEGFSAVVLLGDLIGVSERTIRDKRFLLEVTVWLQTLNSLTNGNVFVVRGNHDIGDFPDFEYFKGIGLIKVPTEVDHYHDGVRHVRYHFVSYGEERRPLRYEGVEDGVHQIVLGHNDYTISGVTNWYFSKNGIELATLGNFDKVSWVISGHIHLPSPDIYSQRMGNSSISLFYPGAPSRVSSSERYSDCYYFTLFYNESEKGFDYDIKRFGLKPVSEVFEENSSEDEVDLLAEKERKEADKRLVDILQTAMNYRMGNANLLQQVDNMVSVSDKVKKVAKSYLQEAIEQL